MRKFSIHGTEEGNTTSIKLDEIAILADPDTLLKIGEFIIKTAHVMKGYEVDYSQLQDEVSDFDYKNNTSWYLPSIPLMETLSNGIVVLRFIVSGLCSTKLSIVTKPLVSWETKVSPAKQRNS